MTRTLARLFATPERRLIAAGVLLTLVYALFSRGVYHSDEHFQILEYAHMKLFGTPTPEHLAWEYRLQMRPGVQPFVAWLVGRGLSAAGIYSPFVLVGILQLLSGALSTSVLLYFYRTVRDELGDEHAQRWFLVLGFGLWFLAYLHVHFSAEMLAGNLLVLLAMLTVRCVRGECSAAWRGGLLLGLVAGATFVVRYQTGFALAGYGVWLLVYCRRRRLYAGIATGVCLALAVGLLADRWLYGVWTLAPLNYLKGNILDGHMLAFGAEPWWYYFTAAVLEGGVLFGVLALGATLWFFGRYPRHIVTWMLVPFLAVHFFLGHKELRFFFPVLFFMPWFIVLWVRSFPRRISGSRGWRWTVGAMAMFNIGAAVYTLAAPTPDICFYRMMRRHCADGEPVVALSLEGEKSYYAMPQPVAAGEGGAMEARFYMPEGFDCRYFATREQLEAAARSLSDEGRRVMIFSPDPELAEKSGLALRKIVWSPYPRWVVRYFNFNDWTRYSVRSKNVYEVAGLFENN